MKINNYIAVLALAVLMTPAALAFAAGSGGGGGGSGSGSGGTGAGTSVSASTGSTGAGLGTQDQDRDRIQDPTTHTGDEPLQTRDQDRLYTSTTSTATSADKPLQDRDRIQDPTTHTGDEPLQDRTRDRISVDTISTTTAPAATPPQLGQMLQARASVLAQEAASTTGAANQQILENQNRSRLAAYAVVASANLMGAAGAQAAQVARAIDDTVPVTANAEAAIASRSFIYHWLFGGDYASAAVLAGQVEQNQARIAQLTQLINASTTPPTLRAQLSEQVQLLQEEQNRLQQVADKEQNRWGLFSWL